MFVTLRTPCVCLIREGQPQKRFTLAGTAVATALAASTFYVAVPTAGGGGVLELFDTVTTLRRTTATLPASPVAATALRHTAAPLVAVALRDCAVVVYSGATAVSRHTTADVVLGMYGGACSAAFALVGASIGAAYLLVVPVSLKCARRKMTKHTCVHSITTSSARWARWRSDALALFVACLDHAPVPLWLCCSAVYGTR